MTQVVLVIKNLPAKAGDRRYTSFISGLGRFPGEGKCNPLQCSCLENLTNRGTWQVTVHAVPRSWTWLKQFSTHVHTYTIQFSSVQSLSRVRLFATPWIAAHQAPLFIPNSRSSLKLTSIELVMASSHLILCRPLLLLSPIPPSIRVFSNESTLQQVAKVLEFQL